MGMSPNISTSQRWEYIGQHIQRPNFISDQKWEIKKIKKYSYIHLAVKTRIASARKKHYFRGFLTDSR